MSNKNENWVVEEKYALYEIKSHNALEVEPSLFDYRTRPYNLDALECIETASTTQELHDYLEENKKDYHNSRFVILPVFNVEFKIN